MKNYRSLFLMIAVITLLTALLPQKELHVLGASLNAPISPWSAETVDDSGDFVYQTSLSLDADDYPRIAYWYREGNNNDLKYAQFEGASWAVETVHASVDSGQCPRIAVDSNGHSHVAWHFDHNAMYGYHDGSTWRLEPICQGCWPGPNSLVLDSDDRPHLSFYHDTNDVLYYHWHDGSLWHAESIDGPSAGFFPSLALDSLNRPHVAYSHVTNKALKFAWYDGTWHIETVYSDGLIYGPVSLALDASDHPHIAQVDESRNRLNYFWSDGSSWHSEFVAEATYDRVFLQLDALDRAHISYSYYDGVNNHVRYAYQSDGGWNVETVAIGGGHSLALDASDQPHISYYDTETEELRYASRTVILSATVDIGPDTLNLKSKGKWVTTYIELPDGYDVADIDISTVILEDTILAEDHPTEVGDYDDDGILDLMVKFDRQELIEYLDGTTGEVTLTVNGALNDGASFEGSDIITVINPGEK